MKKILMGLVIVASLGLTGCGEEKLPPMEAQEFNKIIEYSTINLITQNTEKYTLTEEQEAEINERLEELKQIEIKRAEETARHARERAEELEKIRKLKGDWKVSTFVDDFGDKTKEKYTWVDYTDSKFSNSATRNDVLEGRILVSKSGIDFRSYEYGRRNGRSSEAKFIGGGTLQMRNSKGKTISVPLTDSLCVYNWKCDKHYSTVVNFLKASGGNIRVILNSKYSTTHNITINADGFTYNYKEMRK